MADYIAKPLVGGGVPYWVSDIIGVDNHALLISGEKASISGDVPVDVLEFIELAPTKAKAKAKKKK